MMLLVHVLGGGLGLLTGYIALYATKGATLHRKIGMVFVWAMLTMAITGLLALAAAKGDRRLLSAGALRGAARLKRHLWRMCFAMFIASIAFYLGPNRVPSFMRTPALRGLGVLLPMIAMSYWMWQLRTRRPPRRTVLANAHEPAMAKVSL